MGLFVSIGFYFTLLCLTCVCPCS